MVKDHLANTTDGDFFDQMRKIERDALIKAGDKEALAILDEEERKAKEEAEQEENK